MRKEKFNVCLIGALAQIAPYHVEGIRAHDQLTLYSVCDIDLEALKKRYPELPEHALYTDYLQAVAAEEIDIVINASPNKLHAPISIAALRAGKCVLCEKPMTHSLESAHELYYAAQNSSAFFAVSYHFSFMAEVQRFFEIREKFGTIVDYHFMASENLEVEKPWILDKTQGGPWLDWASNALSVLRAVLGVRGCFDGFSIEEVRRVTSEKFEIELKAEVDLTLGGVSGTISVDWMAPEGSFMAKTMLKNINGDEILLNHATGEILLNGEVYWAGKDRRYVDVYEDFMDRLNTNNTNITIGMQDAKIIEAVREH